MNKKQALIKGYEIALTGKDSIQSQLKLAEAMSEIQEETKQADGMCFTCKYAQTGGCFPSEGVAQTENSNMGWCSFVSKCSIYKEK